MKSSVSNPQLAIFKPVANNAGASLRIWKKTGFISDFFWNFKKVKTKNSVAEFKKLLWILTQMRNEKQRRNCSLKIWLNCCAEFDKIMEMRKSEQNAKITSDFHSAEKIINRNLSKFAESRTVEFTQNRKNINCRTKESGMNYKVEKSTIGNNVYNSLRRNFLSEIPRIFAIFGS